MKLVEDLMLFPSTHVYEPDSKPLQYNDNSLIDSGLKEPNGTFCGLNDYQKDTDPLPFKLNDGDRLLTIPDLHCYTRGDSLRNDNTNRVKDAIEEDTDLYTDKSVMECDLPELIVCYKESYTLDVKDICVDEGVHSPDTVFVENCKEGSLGFSSSFSRRDKEKVDIRLPVLEELKALENNPGNDESIKHYDKVDSLNSDFTKDVKNEMLVPADKLDPLLCEDSKIIDMTNEVKCNEYPIPDELKFSAEIVCCSEDDSDTNKIEEYNECPVPVELKSSTENVCGSEDESDTNDLSQNGRGELKSPAENVCGGGKGEFDTDKSIQNGEVLNDLKEEIGRGELNSAAGTVSGNKDESDSENLIQNREILNDVKGTERDEFKSTRDNICSNKDEFDTKESIQNGEAIKDTKHETDSAISKEKIVPENVVLQQDSGIENSLSQSSKNDDAEVEQQSTEMPTAKKVSLNPTLDSSTEVSINSTLVDDLSYNSKVESGSITFHFDPSSPGASGRTNTPPGSRSSLGYDHDDDASDRLKITNQVQRDHGETSFAPFSGLITYSGAIAYSGSLSHRSDSSTTSTHSFAFPILPVEWSSSPVRMAKADRRHFRKHRGWRHGILCCRF